MENKRLAPKVLTKPTAVTWYGDTIKMVRDYQYENKIKSFSAASEILILKGLKQ